VTLPLGRVILLVAVAVVACITATAFTAGLVVPTSSAGRFQATIDAQALAPAACSSLTLTRVVVGNTGTAADELILGTAGADTIDGGGGADCIVAGGGNDTILGHGGSVCIGGPGTDAFTGCSTQQQ